MDDMLFQNNAKNNIYVLNTSYNKSYDFDSLSRFGSSNRCNEFHSTTDSQDSTSSTSLCSLTQSCYSTTAAIQKLFNYSTEHFTNNCSSSRTSSRRNNNQQQQQQQQCCNGCKNSSSTITSSSSNNEQPTQICSGSLSQSFSGGGGGGGITNRTTSSNVNSTICAKKKKFLKYLEEEKLRKLSIENLPTTNCERSSSRSSKTNGVQNKSNSSKSSSELYQEAVEILGLTCTLCDNCRCLDCQSRYFECDDSDFFMDDCYEYIEQDDDIEECSFYKYPIQQSGSSSGSGSGTSSITTTIVHPETCPQENLLHSNCMEMCDKEIQYDEGLFEDNAAVTELNSIGEEDLD
ncbi:hypothetical protein ACFFRR_008109 [Megaselia abdita]